MGEPIGKEKGNTVEVIEDGAITRLWSTESTKQGSNGISETESVSMGPT